MERIERIERIERMERMERIGVILAGGLGKRMNSHLPKPAHKIGVS